jgi:aspartate racemase
MYNNNKPKIVGILGGYGPYATNDFFKQLLNNTNAKKDWDHLHVIIDNNPRIPSRTRAYLYNEPSPLPYMKEGILRLKKAGADFFVCPCNSAHYFLRKEKNNLELPMLDMVEKTISKIKKYNIKRIGIIASEVTVLSKLYEKPLKDLNIKIENVGDLKDVRFIIEAAKTNKNIHKAKKIMKYLISNFKQNNADAVLYGCTELPIILTPKDSPLPVFDSSYILAEETVIFAENFKLIK